MIPLEFGMHFRNGGEIRCDGSKGLNLRFLVEAYCDDGRGRVPIPGRRAGVSRIDFLLDYLHFNHLLVKLRIPLLKVISDSIWFDVGGIENSPKCHTRIQDSLGLPASPAFA